MKCGHLTFGSNMACGTTGSGGMGASSGPTSKVAAGCLGTGEGDGERKSDFDPFASCDLFLKSRTFWLLMALSVNFWRYSVSAGNLASPTAEKTQTIFG